MSKVDDRIRLLDAVYHDLAVEASESEEVARQAMRDLGLDLSAVERRLAERAKSLLREGRGEVIKGFVKAAFPIVLRNDHGEVFESCQDGCDMRIVETGYCGFRPGRWERWGCSKCGRSYKDWPQQREDLNRRSEILAAYRGKKADEGNEE
jgi:hypothetical protein